MVVRPRTEHSISRRNIDPDALTVLYRLSRSGYIAYLVGGSVRDLLLGLKPKDFDIGTSAHPRQIKDLFRNCFLIGRRFRLAHIRFGDKVIETSTFRQEPDPVATPEETDENEDLYQRRNNTFGTPEQDAHRRDFTVNGLFYDIRSFAVIDHVGGLRDLDARLIRCIGDPDVRLREDPVRMLRAVRFAARLGFTIEPQTYAAICRHHAEIGKAAPPRLYEDLLRLFMHGCSEASFRLLGDCGMLADLFPEVTESAMQDGADAYATWRSLAALDRRLLEGWVAPPAFLLSTLMLGAFHWCVMHTRQSGHDPLHLVIARGLAGGLAARYRMPKRVAYDIADLLSLQGRMADTRPAAMRRTASHPLFEQALALCEIAAEAGLTPAEVPAAWQNVPAGGTDGAPAAAPVDARRRRRRPRGRRRPASPPLPA
jgi:poly(A) polymerase